MKGRVLAAKYRLVAELGRGGMGSVWRAEHVELRSPVAVKLIDPALAATKEGQSRFLREARAAGSLRSSHVVSVFDYGVDDGTPFLVMELLEGESLAQRLEKRGRMALADLQAIVKQVARGLTKAHTAGIVHRDLKPENIFITSEGDTEVVKVLDFGIAKVDANIAVSVQTQTGMVLGTPYYMSPEQAEGRRALDARSDVWSLGVIVFECLLGKRPFDGDNLAQIILAICADRLPVPSEFGEVPAGFDAWFARSVARRLEDRFGSVSELADELGRIAPSPDTVVAGSNAEQVIDRGPLVQSDTFTNSSLEWAKDPPAEASALQSGAFPTGRPRGAASPVSQAIVGVLVLAAAALLGIGGWYWSSSGQVLDSGSDAVSLSVSPGALPSGVNAAVASTIAAATTNAVVVDATVAAAPPSAQGSLLAGGPGVAVAAAASESAPPGLSMPRPSAAGAGSAEAAVLASPKTTGVAVVPAGVGGRTGASTPMGASPAPKGQPDGAPALYCSHNAISGRLVRSSPGKAGSFPCYVHSLSGELRKKE